MRRISPVILMSVLALGACTPEASTQLGNASDQAKQAVQGAKTTMEAVGSSVLHAASGAAEQWHAVKKAVSGD
jgi:hypothetical protein